MSTNAPWRCGGCKQVRKRSAEFCPVCRLPWQSTIDYSYVHNPGARQDGSATWSQDAWDNSHDSSSWSRTRSKSRTHTPKGRRRSKSAQDRQQYQYDGKGHPTQPPTNPYFGKGQGKVPLPPLPPPATPWTGYAQHGQSMMMCPQQMQQMMPMTMTPSQQQHAPQMPVLVAPSAPAPQQAAPPQVNVDAEQKELMEMIRARQMELPPDMRQKVQKMSKKEGAQATKELHSAVRTLGFARKDVEEALQARYNLIASWKHFLADAVQQWQGYTSLFQQQERDLQERIQQAHANFMTAKVQAEQSQQEAGKITPIEIKDDDEELTGEQANADTSSGKIQEGLVNLTASLQQLQAQAESIEIEEKAAKRPRTTIPDQAMETEEGEVSQGTSKQPFA